MIYFAVFLKGTKSLRINCMKTEVGSRKTEDGRKKTEVGRRKSEDSLLGRKVLLRTSDFGPHYISKVGINI